MEEYNYTLSDYSNGVFVSISPDGIVVKDEDDNILLSGAKAKALKDLLNNTQFLIGEEIDEEGNTKQIYL